MMRSLKTSHRVVEFRMMSVSAKAAITEREWQYLPSQFGAYARPRLTWVLLQLPCKEQDEILIVFVRVPSPKLVL